MTAEKEANRLAGYAISSPRLVPVAEANLSVSRPKRCRIETKRFPQWRLRHAFPPAYGLSSR